MPRKQSEVEKSLEFKGFSRPKGRDYHYFQYYSKSGKKTVVFTKTSHGARGIDESRCGAAKPPWQSVRFLESKTLTCPFRALKYPKWA